MDQERIMLHYEAIETQGESGRRLYFSFWAEFVPRHAALRA
jgi:hypothetical protein